MSADLKDFRGKLSIEGWAAVTAESRATGKDMSEIVRDIVHCWALDKILAAKLLHANLESEGIEGILGESRGTAGSVTEFTRR